MTSVLTPGPVGRIVTASELQRRAGSVMRGLIPVVLPLLLIGAETPQARAQAEPVDPPGALPYDLAFGGREFSGILAVTPDGNRVAYVVRHVPPDLNLDVRYMPNGSPSSAVGGRIHITDRQGGSPREICVDGNCWRPVWSPDGRTLAYFSDAEGTPQLWIYDLATGTSRKVSPARVKARIVDTDDRPQWSPDGRTIYVPLAPNSGPGAELTPLREEDEALTSQDGPAVTVLRHSLDSDGRHAETDPPELQEFFLRENHASLAAIDVRTGEIHVVAAAETEPRPSLLRLSASGRWLSYISVPEAQNETSFAVSTDLAVVPTTGGDVRVLAEGIPYSRLSYTWHPTEDLLVYLEDGGLWLVDMRGGAPSARRRLETEAIATNAYGFTRDGRSLVVGIETGGETRQRGIAIVPLDGAEPVRIPIDSGWAYRDVVEADAHTIFQPDGVSITLVLTMRGTGETGIVRVDPWTGESRVLWKGLARMGRLTGGGSHDFLVGTYEDLRTPADLYRFAADFSDRERLTHIEPRLDAVAMGTVEFFETTVPLYDGALATVRTAVLLPPGAERGDRLPAIVTQYPGSDLSGGAASYGGAGALTMPNLLFTSRGYAVVLTHVEIGPQGQAGQPLKEMVDVLLPQVYRAAELGYVDVEHLAIGGQSYGGYATAGIVSATNLFRAAIAVSGVYDLAGTYGGILDTGDATFMPWSEGGQGRMGTHPWANLPRYLQNSPYYRADRILTPLLLLHGDEDRAYHDALKLFSALRRLDRPVELASYDGQGHVISNWSKANAMDAAQRAVAFLREHLGDPGATRGREQNPN